MIILRIPIKGLAGVRNTLAASAALHTENGLASDVMENLTFAADGTDFEIIQRITCRAVNGEIGC